MEHHRAGVSDDSSEEDEPIAVTVGDGGRPNVENPTNEAPSTWMDDDQEDEEEEDAEWSQLMKMRNQSSGSLAAVGEEISEKSPKFKRAFAAIESNGWNTDAWITLLNEVKALPIAEARQYYERFFEKFPSSGRWWKVYADHELREKNYDRAQEIMKKSLMQLRCCDVELWRFYLNFTQVAKVDVAVASKDPDAIRQARTLMCDAYELAVERVGASIHALPIWQSYLAFLQQDQDQTTGFLTTRKVFHRALVMPLQQMETLWKEYEKFERSIPNNEALAQNFFKVFRVKFDASRAVLRDRKKLFDKVNIDALAIPSYARRNKYDNQEMMAWQRIMVFEMENPERLDPIRLKSRIRFTFELSLGCQYHYPEAWYQYAAYETENGDVDAAKSIFKRALEVLPDSSLLHFTFADHLELCGDIAGAKNVYETLLKDHVSALAYVTYQRFCRRALGPKGLEEARKVFKRARKDTREGACTFHVYAASALLEFYSDTSDAGKEVALKIFELGLKKYIQEPEYVLCYLDFLGHLNDDKNMRSLFEKVLAVMPVELSRPIWDRYVTFEHTMVANGGDLATVAKVEARRALAFPQSLHLEMKGLLSVTHRYSFLDLKPPTKVDQCFLDMYTGHPPHPAQHARNGRFGRDPGDRHSAGGGSVAIDLDSIPGPPLPDFLKSFAVMLPLNESWNGPIADVDHVIRAMLLVDFPPREQIEQLEEQQKQQKELQARAQSEQQKQVAAALAAAAAAASGMAGGDNNADGSDLGVISKRPAHDVFRSRQKQKLAKLS